MENLPSFKSSAFLSSVLFLLLLLLFVLSCSACTPPDKFFINCGSNSNITVRPRVFVGENSVSFTRQGSSVVESDSPVTSSIYQSARIFKQQSSYYEFSIDSPGTHVVRLHFSAFSSRTNDLSTARFNVSASGFSLLNNFSVGNSTNAPEVNEFLLSINQRSLLIYFSPERSSFAFINAIEVFPAPDNFIPDNATRVNSTGRGLEGFQGGLNSQVLHPVYRLNVGGLTVTSENDTLWRNWLPDDGFLVNLNSARKSAIYAERPKYSGAITDCFAPDFVYATAREMNINSSGPSSNFNVTWSFIVSRNVKHFVRAHFCDIFTTSVDAYFANNTFSLYINNGFLEEINPYNMTGSLAIPFYVDLVVDSDDSGTLNVSIGQNSISDNKTVFLNGLEIMEVTADLSPVSSIPDDAPKRVFIIVGSVVGGLVLISILVFLVLLRCKKSKPVSVENLEWSPVPGYRVGSTQTPVLEGTPPNHSPLRNLNLGLKIPFSDILIATDNFGPKLLIGKGGFGNVYMGTLRDGTKVAVKRGELGWGQGLLEFQTEIQVLSKIRHRHLVSLIGYCDENSEMILVYEFMEKGTLRDHLYGTELPSLSWKQRLEICIGAARGLHYLHRGSAGGIIHRDIKSTNILLDENYVAKVADFGLSRSGAPNRNHSHVSTVVKGTFGYLDPEYFRFQMLTEKSDVYSFGVVLLEVLCARQALDRTLPSEQVNLADWGMLCKEKGMIEDIVDPSLAGTINPNSLRKFLEVADKCLKEDSADRPNMADVLWDLEYALQLQQTAIYGKPHEDSATTAAENSSVLQMPRVYNSFSSTTETSIVGMPAEENSSPSASEVFSQLRINGPR